MRNLLKFSLLLTLVAIIAGCSTARMASLEEMNSEQQKAQKDFMERADSNAALVRELQNSITEINQRITDIENRIATSQTDDSASTQEIKETLVFLSDQLSRLDKSVQTQRPRPISRGVTAFKPGGFNDNTSYNTALENYKARRYDEAISGFKEILTVAPTSQFADNAQYWIGECYDATGKYELAIEAFNKVFDYPKSEKHPDAQVKIGLIYAKTKNIAQAREDLQAVIDNFPGTNAASIAASKLKTLGD
ncbi:tol-pal system protein YbgF [Candidatus Latescibacterota bacterium]